MEQYLLAFIFGLLSTFILYVVGHILQGQKSLSNSFTKLVIGVLVVTTGYALVVSTFSSYLLIIPLLFVYSFIKERASYHLSWQTQLRKSLAGIPFKKEVLSIILPFYILAFIIFTALYIPDLDGYLHVHPDFSFYAAISEILNKTGIESKLMTPAINGIKHFQFYHYFELWLNAGLTKVFGFTSLYTLVFILIPLLVTVLFTGIFEYLREFHPYFKTKYWLSLALSITVVFLFPYTISFRWLLSFGNDFNLWNPSIAMTTSIKWTVVASGLLYLISDFKRNGIKNLPLILGFIAVIYPPTMITIVPSLFIWMFYALYNKEFGAAKNSFFICGIIIAGMLYVVFNGVLPETSNAGPGTLDLVISYFTEDYTRIFLLIKEPILRTGYMLLAFSPLLILLWFHYKKRGMLTFIKEKKDLIVFLCIAYFISVVGIVLLSFSKDGDQIHSNIFYPFYILLVFLCFVKLFFANSLLRNLAISLFLVTLSISVYGSIDYSNSIENPDLENKEAIIQALAVSKGKVVFLSSEETLKNKRRKHPNFIIPGYNLRFYVEDYFPHALSLDRIKIESIGDQFYLSQGIRSAQYYSEIIEHDLTYKEVIERHDEIKFLIIDKKAPEYLNAEKDYGAVKIGSIDGLVYFELKRI
jgi:hypothetical protein